MGVDASRVAWQAFGEVASSHASKANRFAVLATSFVKHLMNVSDGLVTRSNLLITLGTYLGHK